MPFPDVSSGPSTCLRVPSVPESGTSGAFYPFFRSRRPCFWDVRRTSWRAFCSGEGLLVYGFSKVLGELQQEEEGDAGNGDDCSQYFFS